MKTSRKSIAIFSLAAVLTIPYFMTVNAQENQEQKNQLRQTQQSDQSQSMTNMNRQKANSVDDLTQALGNKIVVLAITDNHDFNITQTGQSTNALKEIENERDNEVTVIRLYTNDHRGTTMTPNMGNRGLDNEIQDPTDLDNDENARENRQNRSLAMGQQDESKILIIDKQKNVHEANLDQNTSKEQLKQEIQKVKDKEKQNQQKQNQNQNQQKQ